MKDPKRPSPDDGGNDSPEPTEYVHIDELALSDLHPTIDSDLKRPDQDSHARDTEAAKSDFDAETIEQTPKPIDHDSTLHPTMDGGSALPTGQSDQDFVVDDTAADSKRNRSRKHSLLGRTLGDYEFTNELGRGGMGVVYKAHDKRLGRDVAIKMVLESGMLDSQARVRFETEARAVARLDHPNIVKLFEFGELSGHPYLALEFVPGGTLVERTSNHPLEPKEAARITEALARAMDAAHQQGTLHRDIKPANILMTSDGTPKLSDFGLAKELIDANQTDTRTGTVLGTPSFMSPEQAQGDVKSLTGATDQYSLGAVLYTCLSGRPPFMSASAIDTITQVVTKDPIPLRQLSTTIPKDLETICSKALQKDPEKRYESCDAMADDLRRFIVGEPILARPVGWVERATRWCRRNPKVAIPSGIAASFIIATAFISSWAWTTTAAQAAMIAQERDNAREERDKAEVSREEAARQEAIALRQKAVAEENKELAISQAKLALENIQFFITDVDSQLQSKPGMQELRISVLDAVSERWDELDLELVGGVRGEAIPTMMSLRQLIAIAYRDLDQLEKAQTEFSKLEKMARERIALKGRTDSTRSNLAKILMVSSTLPRRLGSNPEKGKEMLEEGIDLIREIIRDPQPLEGSPSENNILLTLGALEQNLGVEYLRDGLLAETERHFTAALDANTKVLENIRATPGFDELDENKRDTQTAELQIELDKSRYGLAYIRVRLGKVDEAIPLFESAIQSRREIFDRRKEVLRLKKELASVLTIYGKSLLWLRRTEAAEPILREALTLSDEVVQANPQSPAEQRSLADSVYLMATLRKLQSRDDESSSLFERCRLLRTALYEKSPDEKNRINLMLAEAALGNREAAIEHIKSLGESEETNSELHLERARALAALAGQPEITDEESTQLRDQALDALQRSIDEGFAGKFRIGAEWELDSIRNTKRYVDMIAQLD